MSSTQLLNGNSAHRRKYRDLALKVLLLTQGLLILEALGGNRYVE